jgi:putative ABC transport system permease protein
VSEGGWLSASRRWLRTLLRLYPADFREEMGGGVVEAYMERCRTALRERGVAALLGVWARALVDSVRNGPGERLRPAASWRRSGNWGRDMELTLRRLVRAPLFAATLVGTLVVGLGAFAVVFAVVQNVLLAPMPYEDPDDLYFVWRDYTAFFDLDRGWLGGTDVHELQQAGGALEDAAALQRGRFTLTGPAGLDATDVAVMLTSPNLFELLGVRAAVGRGFAADEGGADAPKVIVLGHALWTRLGEEASIVGTDLRLNGQPYQVIGVMPRDFRFMRNSSLGPPEAADAYIPLAVDLATTNPGSGSYAGVIRARPGTPPEGVAAAVAAVGSKVDERDFEGRGLKLWPIGLKEDLVARVRPALVVLGAAGAFLVLVLMVNLAALLMARAGQREREFAVARALGANPSAVMRATLLEGGVLGLLGGVGGTLAAIWGTRVLVALAPLDMPRRDAIAVDWQTALVVMAVGGLMGLVAATAPAAWAARVSLASLLHSAAVRGGGGGHGTMRRGMVVLQVALSLVLLTAGGLVVRSFERLLRSDPGFRPDGVLTMRVPMSSQIFPDTAHVRSMQDRILAGLAALPGVSAASATMYLPLSADADQTTLGIPGAPANTGDEDHDHPLVDYFGIRNGYVEAMGMRVIAGRSFDTSRPTDVPEVLIDHTLAEYFFPGADAVGALIPFGGDTVQVIGVVRQARLYDVHLDGRPQILLRAEDLGERTLTYVVRSDRDAASLIREAGSVIRDVEPQLAISDVRTMGEVVNDALRQQRVTAVLIAGFSLGALLLAAMGLFGVVAAAVNQRRHEIAVRLALGAPHARVLRLVMGEGARLILFGVVIGLPTTLLAGRLLEGFLVGVQPSDPPTLAAVAVGLGTVALAACWLPARRVLGIDPGKSLRQD